MKRLALILCFLPSLCSGATLFLKTGGGAWGDASTWSNVNAGGVDNSGPPTLNDDTIAELLSGNVTVDKSTDVCKSFSATDGTGSWTGTLTHNAATTWVMGSTLTFSAGMTYTRGAGDTSAISFKGTGSTGTVTTAGKTVGNMTFASSGVYYLADNLTGATTASIVFTSGTLHMDGPSDVSGLTHSIGLFNANNSNPKALNLGLATITVVPSLGGAAYWALNVSGTNLISASSSTINMAKVTGASGFSFDGGTNLTYGALNLTALAGQADITVTDANTFSTFTVTGAASKSFNINISSNETITKKFLIAGNSAVNRILINSGTVGTPRTITVTGSTPTWSNVDFKDIAISGYTIDASTITGASGDCGGNSGITFSSSTAQMATGTASFTWSTHGWSTRVPLCQDDVWISNAFISGRTVTCDMPRWGRNINASTATWSGTGPIFSASSVNNSVFGSLLFPTQSGATMSGNAGLNIEGRNGSFVFASAGLTLSTGVTFRGIQSTYTLQDAYTDTGFTTSFDEGVFNANNFNLTAGLFTFNNNGHARIMNMGSGVWTATGTTPWQIAGIAGITINAGTSTIYSANTTASAKTFTGAGATYYDLLVSSSPSSGSFTLSGNNSFHDMNVRSPKFMRFTNGSTTTITGNVYTDSVQGSSVCFFSTTGGSRWFFDSATPNVRRECLDWVSMKDGQVRPAVGIWFAGDSGTDTSNNANWRFESCLKQSDYFLML